MTTGESSSYMNNTENGGRNPRQQGRVFDAASEDDPLLQEPLLLPNHYHDKHSLPDAIPEQSPVVVVEEDPLPPPPSSPSFGVFTRETHEYSQKKKRVVSYNSDSHIRVLFGMYGSVWPSVLPFCLVAVVITFVISYLQTHDIVDLTFASSTGHQFMAIMVSFLVVTRANITYARFMEARNYLSECYRCCRELVQHTCILTLYEDSLEAQEWRRQVAYRTILLLRITMAAIEVSSILSSSECFIYSVQWNL